MYVLNSKYFCRLWFLQTKIWEILDWLARTMKTDETNPINISISRAKFWIGMQRDRNTWTRLTIVFFRFRCIAILKCIENPSSIRNLNYDERFPLYFHRLFRLFVIALISRSYFLGKQTSRTKQTMFCSISRCNLIDY